MTDEEIAQIIYKEYEEKIHELRPLVGIYIPDYTYRGFAIPDNPTKKAMSLNPSLFQIYLQVSPTGGDLEGA